METQEASTAPSVVQNGSSKIPQKNKTFEPGYSKELPFFEKTYNSIFKRYAIYSEAISES